MPRLLSLNTYHYRRGGSDVVYFEHDAMFRAAGWETAVMAMHHPRNESSRWSRFFADEIEFGHEYGLLAKLAMAGKVIYSREAKRKLGALLDQFPADVAHGHCIYHHLSPSVLVELKERGIPTVLTSHDLKLACPSYKMVNRGGICERCKGGNLFNVIRYRCVRDSLPVSGLIAVETAIHKLFGLYRNNLDRIVAPSHFMRNKLIEWGWDAERIVYIPNYVHVDRFTPRYQPGDYFVYFGRLQLDKGIGTVVKAAVQAGVPLQVVGTGPDEAYVKQLAQGHEQIVFRGYQQGESLWDIVGGARCAVLASEIYENAPMSVLEAYALGKPVIGARIAGIPEMVQDGRTGALFESGNVEELAAALRRFADLPDAVVAEMGEAARVHVASTFTAQRYFNDMLALYAGLGVRMQQSREAA
jgi:glycosyltransferase involved in cell wall biosynthesis